MTESFDVIVGSFNRSGTLRGQKVVQLFGRATSADVMVQWELNKRAADDFSWSECERDNGSKYKVYLLPLQAQPTVEENVRRIVTGHPGKTILVFGLRASNANNVDLALSMFTYFRAHSLVSIGDYDSAVMKELELAAVRILTPVAVTPPQAVTPPSQSQPQVSHRSNGSLTMEEIVPASPQNGQSSPIRKGVVPASLTSDTSASSKQREGLASLTNGSLTMEEIVPASPQNGQSSPIRKGVVPASLTSDTSASSKQREGLASLTNGPVSNSSEQLEEKLKALYTFDPSDPSASDKEIVKTCISHRYRNMLRSGFSRPNQHLFQSYLRLPDGFKELPLPTGLDQMKAKMVLGIGKLLKESGYVQMDWLSVDEFISQKRDVAIMNNNGYFKEKCSIWLQNLDNKYVDFERRLKPQEEVFRPAKSLADTCKADLHCHLGAMVRDIIFEKTINRYLNSEEKVTMLDGTACSMKEVFRRRKLSTKNIHASTLRTTSNRDNYKRFCCFNEKFYILRDEVLTDVLTTKEGLLEGRIFGSMTGEEFDLREQEGTLTEVRVSLGGKDKLELARLAAFLDRHNLLRDSVQFVIQIPRRLNSLIAKKKVKNFAEALENIFLPVLEASLHPASYPQIAKFLARVSGVDSVDDEDVEVVASLYQCPTSMSDASLDVGMEIWWHYIFNNIVSINTVRRWNGLNIFIFAPHVLEEGNKNNATLGFLLGARWCHGRQLDLVPTIHYLAYLVQVPIVCSLASNTALAQRNLAKHAFAKFLRQGLNVMSSSDDGLIFAMLNPAVVLEFQLMLLAFGSTMGEMYESVRNSVLASPWADQFRSEVDSSVHEIRVFYRQKSLTEALEKFFGEKSAE